MTIDRITKMIPLVVVLLTTLLLLKGLILTGQDWDICHSGFATL